MKYHLWTIGCQYNEWDGARLSFFMQKLGFAESKPDEADVIIVIACSVKQAAVDRMFSKINNWRKGRPVSRDRKPTVIVSGCVLDSDKMKFANKDIRIFESGDFETLFKYLQQDFSLSPRVTSKLDLNNKTMKPFDCSQGRQFNNSSAFVPIMVGCNNFCSYCAVPYTRGREKSRPMDEVIADVKDLIKQGHKEIMLLGQNVNSYKNPSLVVIPAQVFDSTQTMSSSRMAGIHKRLVDSRFHGNDSHKSDFSILLDKLNNLDGDFVISFMSNHPKDMTGDIIEAVATLPKIKKQIHLPLQSGSDKILKAMNRPYTINQYLDLIENCKLKIDNLVLSTDVIVGFPGETEQDFQDTVKVFKEVDYAVAFINKYSPRAGTAAYKLGDPISWDEKKRRWKILNELIKRNPRAN